MRLAERCLGPSLRFFLVKSGGGGRELVVLRFERGMMGVLEGGNLTVEGRG